MPAVRKRPVKTTAGSPPAGQVAQTTFISDRALSDLGVPIETAGSQLADVAAVYAMVDANPWVGRDELTAWATAMWPTEPAVGEPGPVDRLNRALAVLEQAGKVARLEAG